MTHSWNEDSTGGGIDLATDKRARKKAARDALLEQRAAEARRRKYARLGGVGLVLALVIGLALTSGNKDEGKESAAAGGEKKTSEEVACGAERPEEADPQQYDSAPPLELEDGVNYAATIRTSCGDIHIDLLEDKAPASVANFVFLAEEGFYDGLIWHRVEQNAVIQTGDPDGQNGQEPDGPGYSIPDEFPDKGSEYIFGTVGMANAGPGTTGSQFFVVVHDPEKSCDAKGNLLKGDAASDPEKGEYCPAGYQPLYSIFAVVLPDSFETLLEIAKQPTKGGNDPVEAVKPVAPVYIESIEIERG